MAGICEGHRALGIDARTAAGDEASVFGFADLAIEAMEELGGGEVFRGQCAECADGECAGHGGLEALAADIANDDEGSLSGLFDDLIEISCDFFGGDVGGFDVEAGERGKRVRDELLLNFASGGNVGC